jgi:hypothetical protein
MKTISNEVEAGLKLGESLIHEGIISNGIVLPNMMRTY